MLEELKEAVYEANMAAAAAAALSRLPGAMCPAWTVSKGLMVIKPSGVDYETMNAGGHGGGGSRRPARGWKAI